jgi:microcystin-dependent protein
MSEPFIGEIKIVGFTFAPRGWADCDGQIVSISQNTALFSLLGVTYGGDGTTTFALPDLRSRLPMHTGSGSGLSPRSQGARSGNESTTLSVSNLAAHSHSGTVISSPAEGDRSDPAGAYPARAEEPMQAYAGTTGATMAAGSVQTYDTGNGSSFSNMPPFLVVRFIIAMVGIFPSRN